MTLITLLEERGIQVQDRFDHSRPVFKAKRSDGTNLVIKTVDANCSELQKAMIQNEFAMQNAIGAHPNICQSYGLITIQTENGLVPVLQIGYINGNTLEQCFEDLYTSPDGDHLCFKALRGAIDGIKHMHKNGVLHLDIKPGNFMVDENGEGVLIDFGSAKFENGEYPPGLQDLLNGVFFCTPYYAAPEMLNRRVPVTKKTDAYQLGASVMEAVTQFVPYRMFEHGDLVLPMYEQPIDIIQANSAMRDYPELKEMFEKARLLDPSKRPTVEDISEVVKSHEAYFRNHPDHKRLLPLDSNTVSSHTTDLDTGIPEPDTHSI